MASLNGDCKKQEVRDERYSKHCCDVADEFTISARWKVLVHCSNRSRLSPTTSAICICREAVYPSHRLESSGHRRPKGAVAVFGRSCLPGRTSRLAATCVHINQRSRPISRRLLHTRFAFRRKSFPAERTYMNNRSRLHPYVRPVFPCPLKCLFARDIGDLEFGLIPPTFLSRQPMLP